MYKQTGFTLVELLVVLSIIGIVLGLGVNALASTLRSTTKTTTYNTVKQSGDFAIEAIARRVRNAVDVCTVDSPDDADSVHDEIRIYNSRVITCPPAALAPVERFLCRQGSAGSNGGIYQGDAQIRLTSNVKVKEGTCNFTASNSVPRRVTIRFTLKQDVLLPETAETKVEIPFFTEVNLRNF